MRRALTGSCLVLSVFGWLAAGSPVRPAAAASASIGGHRYPMHTRIVATTFWVGEIFDANAPTEAR